MRHIKVTKRFVSFCPAANEKLSERAATHCGAFAMDSQPEDADLGAMTVKEFCRRYRIGITKLYEEIKAGRLRAVKCGTRTLILNRDGKTWEHNLSAIYSPQSSTV